MRPIPGSGWLILLSLVACGPGSAYVPSTGIVNGRLAHYRWRITSMPIPFVASDPTWRLLSNLGEQPAVLGAVEAAMAPWEVGPAALRFNGTVATHDVAWDGVNLITLADTPHNRDFIGNYVANAVRTSITTPDGEIRTINTDIVLNPQERFALDSRTDAYDLQGILAHQLGHALGLDHSAVTSATMFPQRAPGEVHQRTVELDDLAGIRFLYNVPSPPGTGAIVGRVVTSAGSPVWGAHVAAIDSAGVLPLAALTDWDGNFALSPLPTGEYQLYAEPLDGPMTRDNLIDAFQESPRPMLRDFPTTFLGGNERPLAATVRAGQVSRLDPIRVEVQKPILNPRDWVWTTDVAGPWRTGPARVRAGAGGFFSILGDNLSTVPASGVSASGSDITVDPSGVRYDGTTGANQRIVFPFQVSAGARLGPRSIYLASGTARAALTGVLEVAP